MTKIERIDYLQGCNKAAVFATIVRSMAILIAMVHWLEEVLAPIKQEKCQEAIIPSQEESRFAWIAQYECSYDY